MSIATAIENAQNKINSIYTKLEEAGVEVPEDKNLDNLALTIETVGTGGGGDTVGVYMSGITLATPTSGGRDKQVLLTKVGYQLIRSETLSPNIRLYYINENGWVLDSSQNRYDIVNGVVDASTKFDHTNGIYSDAHLPLFFKNGNAYGFLSTTSMTITSASTGYMDTYSYETSKRLNTWSSNMNTRTFFLDFGWAESRAGCSLTTINDDLSETDIKLNNLTSDIYASGHCFVAGLESKFWVLSIQSNGTGKLIQFVKNGDTYVPTLLSTQTVDVSALSMPQGSIFLASKQVISTDTGVVAHTLHKNGYIKFDINTQNSSESFVTFNTYPQGILDFIGNRTIYKIQCFYDNTFSLDLSDGTTLICGFGGDNYEPVIQEVVEPFIIDGDTNIYHINFSERKMYWIQANTPLAPISANPWGAYNSTKATVDWLAIPREKNRWNTSVLTGVIRYDEQIKDPVYDETGRRVVNIETAIADDTVYPGNIGGDR